MLWYSLILAVTSSDQKDSGQKTQDMYLTCQLHISLTSSVNGDITALFFVIKRPFCNTTEARSAGEGIEMNTWNWHTTSLDCYDGWACLHWYSCNHLEFGFHAVIHVVFLVNITWNFHCSKYTVIMFTFEDFYLRKCNVHFACKMGGKN